MAKQPSEEKCEGMCAGELKPQAGDTKLGPADTSESVMTKIALACDDDTGVFFYRHKGSLYMRVLEAK